MSRGFQSKCLVLDLSRSSPPLGLSSLGLVQSRVSTGPGLVLVLGLSSLGVVRSRLGFVPSRGCPSTELQVDGFTSFTG